MTSIASKLHSIKKMGIKGKSKLEEISGVSPLDAVKLEIRKEIEKSQAYIANLFRQKPTFASITDHQLRTIAQSLEKLTLHKGHVIMEQGSLGDRCFILESGIASADRKLLDDTVVNIDTYYKDTMIGEMCFFTDELRPTTITIISEHAKLYMLLKSTYLSIIDSTKQVVVEIRDHMARDVCSKVPIFQKLTSTNRQQVIDAMIPVQFPERTYICRQGKIGKGFYVIVEGKCLVTYSTPTGERDIRMLESGDYFGIPVDMIVFFRLINLYL